MRRSFLVAVALLACGCGHHPADPPPAVAPASLMSAIGPDMVPATRTVAGKDNGYLMMDKAADLYLKSDAKSDDVSLGPISSPADASDILEQTGKIKSAIDLMKRAGTMPNWAVPARDPAASAPFANLARMKSLVKALVARGTARIYLEKNAEGVSDLLAVRGASLGILNGRGVVIDALVGMACLSIADRAIERECAEQRASSDAIRMLLAGIPEAPTADHGFQEALRQELLQVQVPDVAKMNPFAPATEQHLAIIQNAKLMKMARELPTPFDRRATIEETSRAYSLLVRNLAKSWREREDAQVLVDELTKGWPAGADTDTTFTDDQVSQARSALDNRPNAMGRLMVGGLLKLFDQALQSSFRWRQRQEALRAILAMRLWRNSHGNKLPPSLDVLVSGGILKRLPRDFYGNGPLHYDPRRMLIWSVGEDGNDDGGMDKPDSVAKVKDLVWPATGAY